MSQQQLEQTAELSKGYVSRIQRGERVHVSPDVLRRVAEALEVSYEWLATGKGEMERAVETEPGPSKPKDGVSTKSAGDLSPLEVAIAYHTGRWSRAAVAAARELAKEEEAPKRTPQEWADALVEIEEALLKIRRPAK
jgi:transcriptional regulator with XRE-family HTH domain